MTGFVAEANQGFAKRFKSDVTVARNTRLTHIFYDGKLQTACLYEMDNPSEHSGVDQAPVIKNGFFFRVQPMVGMEARTQLHLGMSSVAMLQITHFQRQCLDARLAILGSL